jgi:hypothetical protein
LVKSRERRGVSKRDGGKKQLNKSENSKKIKHNIHIEN